MNEFNIKNISTSLFWHKISNSPSYTSFEEYNLSVYNIVYQTTS